MALLQNYHADCKHLAFLPTGVPIASACFGELNKTFVLRKVCFLGGGFFLSSR